jgi:hypothetical protein
LLARCALSRASLTCASLRSAQVFLGGEVSRAEFGLLQKNLKEQEKEIKEKDLRIEELEKIVEQLRSSAI